VGDEDGGRGTEEGGVEGVWLGGSMLPSTEGVGVQGGWSDVGGGAHVTHGDEGRLLLSALQVPREGKDPALLFWLVSKLLLLGFDVHVDVVVYLFLTCVWLQGCSIRNRNQRRPRKI
jgi:hypothetical protein